jgi:hypothetical protein
MTRFGWIMHVGVDGGKLKTEAMCYPPTLEEASKMKNEAPGVEGATFAVNEGCITFTHKFKHLGSLLTQDLKDKGKIRRQINQARRGQVRELTNMWMSKDIATNFKKTLHIPLPPNMALCGAPSRGPSKLWTLTANNERGLQSFHHKSIRQTLTSTCLRQRR